MIDGCPNSTAFDVKTGGTGEGTGGGAGGGPSSSSTSGGKVENSYLVSRPLDSEMLGSSYAHMFIVVGAEHYGDENAQVYSFGKLSNGNTGNVGPGSTPDEMSETTYESDRAFWLSLKNNETKAKLHTSRIAATPAVVRKFAETLAEDTKYQPVDDLSIRLSSTSLIVIPKALSERSVTTNSNSAAWAVANRAASYGKKQSVIVPLPDPSRMEPNSMMWKHVKFHTNTQPFKFSFGHQEIF